MIGEIITGVSVGVTLWALDECNKHRAPYWFKWRFFKEAARVVCHHGINKQSLSWIKKTIHMNYSTYSAERFGLKRGFFNDY